MDAKVVHLGECQIAIVNTRAKDVHLLQPLLPQTRFKGSENPLKPCDKQSMNESTLMCTVQYVYTHIHTHTHTYTHTYTHIHTHTYAHTYAHAQTHTRVHIILTHLYAPQITSLFNDCWRLKTIECYYNYCTGR